jgi:pimeloyl-ACP methyl ester carboxylesterase
MGVSTGGETLLHMATQQPDRVEAMVLIGTAPYITEQEREWERRLVVDSEDWDWDGLRQYHVHGDAQIRALLNQLRNFKDSYDDVNFTPPYLSTITAQTLIVHGDRDQVYPVPIPVKLFTWIPNAYLWFVPNGGHIPILHERTEVFTQIALDFLRGNWETA